MALIKCKECGHEVSKRADKCPSCGAPIKKKTSILSWLLLLFLIFVFIGYLADTDTTNRSSSTSRVSGVADTPPKDIRYAHRTINIRKGPGKNYEVVGQLRRGDSIEVTRVEKKWAKVSIAGIPKGYVYEPLLKSSPLPPLEIADWNWYTDPSFGVDGAVIWNVEVRNNTSKYIEYVKVEFSTYDANDKLITSDFTYVKGLPPGGTATAKSYATYFGEEKTGRIRIVP